MGAEHFTPRETYGKWSRPLVRGPGWQHSAGAQPLPEEIKA